MPGLQVPRNELIKRSPTPFPVQSCGDRNGLNPPVGIPMHKHELRLPTCAINSASWGAQPIRGVFLLARESTHKHTVQLTNLRESAFLWHGHSATDVEDVPRQERRDSQHGRFLGRTANKVGASPVRG